jgi:mannose-6-phosphate isomerase-like protein (cupin superfamily)
MENRIKIEDAAIETLLPDIGDIAMKELLADEIVGVRTKYISVKSGCTYESISNDNNYHILFFTKGSGNVTSSGQVFEIDEMAVFRPAFPAHFSITSINAIEFIEILYEADEKDHIISGERNSPYFNYYSKFRTYREAIKSEKTINRTIIDINMMPRFCMGSVETYGKDMVSAHSHPIVDQLFFGLPGNSCFVKADNEEVPFGENTLLHIPRGSEHSVMVEEGQRLHYLWLDFFENDDMSYIKDSHIAEE